ncbi:hypothetical protein BK5-Tp47 [Lactococcus phage BK5-T]|uniref:Uncharacterized protein n=1 Tax=Lactococcus phage BK5-T TaxID=31754 RepID=Q94M93_9CAUD|nr:hypothetical protein BK5-Tp47 [Lactococcus phage BK5-T]YP_010133267.1 hypothetical protein K3164_gp47 [Lactococcus phage BK5-T]AAK56826.1 unknown [Lactococcus phage BK5-T]CAC80188.1 hypothetical protein [Lactococcus phage BK5-T]
MTTSSSFRKILISSIGSFLLNDSNPSSSIVLTSIFGMPLNTLWELSRDKTNVLPVNPFTAEVFPSPGLP